MPVPFRDAEEIEELGSAAYLCVQTSDDAGRFRGALFLINARGEPLEFSYNSVEVPTTFLWRQDDIRKHAIRKLTTSLLTVCRKTPRLVVCLAEEVGWELFCNDIHLSVPVCRIASALKAIPHSSLEVQVPLEQPQPLHLFWFPAKPADDSVEYHLFNRLTARGLLLEPFDRALVGLAEVYADEGSSNTGSIGDGS